MRYADLKKMILGDDSPPDTVKEDYRRTFNTETGRRVLAHMLVELNFFGESVSEEEVVLNNYARRLLYHLGVLRGENIPVIVAGLMNIKTHGGKNEEDI